MMQFIVFAVIAMFVAFGVQRMSQDIKQPRRTRTDKPKTAISAQEMVPCPLCQAYVLKGAPHDCGGDNPFPPAPPAA